MCYVCSCFAWVLDFIQRVVTFLLACWISCAVIMGLIVAIFAGVAYGYNYSMAEFLTFTQSDVTVYMRRGQFYDRPDVQPRSFRRSGDGEDAFPDTNPNPGESGDYESKNPPKEVASPLQDSWVRSHDTRNYAEKLTKYNPVFEARPPDKHYVEEAVQANLEETPAVSVIEKQVSPTPHGYYRMTSSPFRTKLISITPNKLMSTALWQSGNSKIVMRNFHLSTLSNFGVVEDEPRHNELGPDFHPSRTWMPTYTPIAGFGPEDVTKSSHEMPLRHWGQSTAPVFQDYTDIDEDNIIYKPG